MSTPEPMTSEVANPQSIFMRLEAWLRTIPRWVWFTLVVSVIVVGAFVMRPSLTWRAEPLAEIGENFYHHAVHSSVVEAIAAGDYGSMALPIRFTSLLLVKVFGFHLWYVHAIQLVGIVTIAVSCACLLLPAFDRFRIGLGIRSVLGALIGLGVYGDYECFAAINAAYFLFIPMLALVLGLFKADIGYWSGLWRGGLLAFLITGKVYFVAFALPLLVCLGLHLWRRRWQGIIGPLLGLLFVVLQVWQVTRYDGAPPQVESPPPQRLIDAFAHFAASFRHVLAGELLYQIPWLLIFMGVSAAFVWAVWRERRDWVFVGSLLFLGCVIGIIAGMNGRAFEYWARDYHLFSGSNPTHVENRHSLLISVAALLIVILTARAMSKKVLVPLTMVVAAAAILPIGGYSDIYPIPEASAAQWRQLLPLAPQTGVIPVNPLGRWYATPGHGELAVLEPNGVLTLSISHYLSEPLPGTPTALIVEAGYRDGVEWEGMTLQGASMDGAKVVMTPASRLGIFCYYFVIPPGKPVDEIQLVSSDGGPVPLNRIFICGQFNDLSDDKAEERSPGSME